MQDALKNLKSATKEQVKYAIDAAGVLSMLEGENAKTRFVQSAYQLSQQPGISECTTASVMGCLLKAATFNFPISPELGQCWVVPRNSVVKGPDGKNLVQNGRNVYEKLAVFQIGYKGWQELAFRAKSVESFDTGEIWEKDVFDFAKGSNPFLTHKKTLDHNNRGKRIGFYASATLPSGRLVFDVITPEEAEEIRMRSETQYKYSEQTRQKVFSAQPIDMWAKYYAQMVYRSPIKKICTTRIQTSIEIQNGVMYDNGITIVKPGGEVVEISPNEVYKEEQESLELASKVSEDALDALEAAATRGRQALVEEVESLKRNISDETAHKSIIEAATMVARKYNIHKNAAQP